MEGLFWYNPELFPQQFVDEIKRMKSQIGICSLSRVKNNLLMWSHYANGSRGIAIGVELDHHKHTPKPVIYGDLPNFKESPDVVSTDTALNILSHKHSAWEYEKEERVFTLNYETYVNCSIQEIVMGSKIDPTDEELLKKLIEKVNPTITITRIEDDDLE